MITDYLRGRGPEIILQTLKKHTNCSVSWKEMYSNDDYS